MTTSPPSPNVTPLPALTRWLLASTLLLAACDPITMGLVTASGGLAVNHQMSSTATRTFSEDSQQVQQAVLAALDRMSMVVTHHDHSGTSERIDATAGSRSVSLRVEPVTRTTTLLQVGVHQDLLTMDGATAREIVAQTEHILADPALLQAAMRFPSGTASAGAPDADPGRGGTLADPAIASLPGSPRRLSPAGAPGWRPRSS